MVGKKIGILLLSIVIIAGCGIKKDSNTYENSITPLAYVNQGNTTTTETTTSTLTTTVKRTTTTSTSTNDDLSIAKNNINTYINTINEMISVINRYRREKGLSDLEYNYELSLAASIRAAEMSRTGVFEHTRPDGSKWSTVYKELGIKYNRAAENISYGFNDVERAMKAFMNSPTHEHNIMNPDLKYVGIGVAPTGNTFYYAQEFKA